MKQEGILIGCISDEKKIYIFVLLLLFICNKKNTIYTTVHKFGVSKIVL